MLRAMPAQPSFTIAEARPFTVFEAIRQTFARFYVLIPVCLAGAAGTYVLAKRMQPSWSSTATVRLLPPTVRPQMETGVQLPREEMPDPDTLANTLQELVLAAEGLTKLMASKPAIFEEYAAQGEKHLLWVRSRSRIQSRSQNVFVVEAWGRNSDEAEELARYMARATMDAYKKVLRDRAETLAKFTRDQAQQANKELTEHEEAMVGFLRANPALLVSAMDRDRRLATSGPDRMRVQAMLKRAGGALAAKDPALKSLMEERDRLNAELRSLRGGDNQASAGAAKLSELQEAKRHLSQLRSEGRGDADPAVKLAQKQVDRIEAELKQIKPGEGGTSAVEAKARARLKEIEAKIQKGIAKQPQSSPRLEAQWGEMLRKQGLLVKRFEGFNRLANAASFDNGLGLFETKDLTALVADASEPKAPKGVRPKLVFAIGVFLSLLLGIGLAVLVGRLDRKLYSTAEVRALVGIPLLAELPRQSSREALASSDEERVTTDQLISWSKKEEVTEVGFKPSDAPRGGGGGQPAVAGLLGEGNLGRLALPPHQETGLQAMQTSIVLGGLLSDEPVVTMQIRSVVASPPLAPGLFLATAPRGLGADQVRLLAGRFTDGASGSRMLLVAGWEPRSGRTTVAANLAMALAEARRRALLVDSCGGDASLTRLLGLRPEEKTGLYEQLSARMSGEQSAWTVYRIAESLSMIPSSSQQTPMGPMLSSVAFGDLMEQCRGIFDVIVIDSRPLSEASDAVILHSKADAVIAVMRRRKSRLDGLRQLVDQMDDRRIVGTVFNLA